MLPKVFKSFESESDIRKAFGAEFNLLEIAVGQSQKYETQHIKSRESSGFGV